MRSGRAVARRDALSAAQMERRLAGDSGSETESNAAVMASLVRQCAQRVAFGMIAGSTAWSPGRSGSGNDNDAHGFILSGYGNHKFIVRLEHLTACSKQATYS